MMQTFGRASIAWKFVAGFTLALAVVATPELWGAEQLAAERLAGDRTRFLLPLSSEAKAQEAPPGRYADEIFPDAIGGWRAYVRLWKAHHLDPANPSIRRFLGLPLTGELQWQAQRGRGAPSWLGWRAGTYAQVDTPHFVIYSRAGEEPSRRVAEDLERCYWVWTQMFFPLWEGAAQVSAALAPLGADQEVGDFLKENRGRITIRRKLQVVLFSSAQEYQQTLGRDVPGIERSTGYYNEPRQMTFLYADDMDDEATRRHEMVHQLFREATRSGLGRSSPGESSGFWLVEGIAGYFESLHLDSRIATLGGWESPRLQFARYRIINGGDRMPMDELVGEGRGAVQQRADLARWYSHAIAQTHLMLDGGDAPQRAWVYQQLAQLYKVRAELPESSVTLEPERSLRDFLVLTDRDLVQNPVPRELRELCLAGCEVSDIGLESIAPSSQLRWLDLTRIPVGNEMVRRLAPRPESLEQLTLEATRIDAGLLEWLARADNLRELDLSWTPLDDLVIRSLSTAKGLSILWLTGTKISDASIDAIAAMPALQSVDVQRSDVSDAGLARLRAARPDLQINPLELRQP